MQHLSDEHVQLLEWSKEQPLSVYQLDPADRVVLKIADERDAIQKKTFTKWVNKHLKKAGKTVNDLFEDLQDGHNLLSLLEVLSGELLARERGRMRFHKVQNCNAGLQFLKYRKIKVVNIRPEDIVDGNPKLTLGLIWTIILHFQISVNLAQSHNQGQAEASQQHEELNAREARNALLVWVRDIVKGYPGVSCKDFSRSWRDGLAFSALFHRYRPQLIDFRAARQRTNRENLEIAFSIAEKEFNVTRLLDPEDVDTPEPDDKSVITYVSSLYDVLSNTAPQLEPLRESRTNLYVDQAAALSSWMTRIISQMHKKYETSSDRETRSLIKECASLRSDDLPKKLAVKNQLSELYYELENLYINAASVPVKEEIQPATLDKVWRLMLQAIDNREHALHDDLRRCERLHPKAESVRTSVLIIVDRLNQLRDQMKQDELRIRSVKNPYEAKSICDNYDTQLRDMDVTIRTTMTDARTLRDARYYDAETIYCTVLEVQEKFITIKRFYQEGIIAQILAVTVRQRVVISLLVSVWVDRGKTFTAEERQVARRVEKISSTRLVEQREQSDDSQSDDTRSFGSDGSYASTSGLGLRSDANGMSPVVHIQSYNERGVANAGLWINGKEVASGAGPGEPVNGTHGSHLVHGRSPYDNLGAPQANGDRRRSSSTLEPVLHSAEPHQRTEPKSDGASPKNKQSMGLYYFGAPNGNGSRRGSTDSGASSAVDSAGRRGSSSDHRLVGTQTNGQKTVDAEVQYHPPIDPVALQRKARADSLKEKANQVLVQLEAFSQTLAGLDEQCSDLSTWVSQCRASLSVVKPINFSSVTSIQDALVDIAKVQKQVTSRGADLSALRTQVESARGQSKGLTALLNEHRAHMSGTPPAIYAQSNELQTALANTTAQLDQLTAEVSNKQQNLQCLVELLVAYNAHHDEATGWMSVHERHINEAEGMANDKHSLEMAKLRFEELERQMGEFQNQMDRLVGINGDIQLRTDNQAEEMRGKQDKLLDRWEELKRAGSDRMRALDSVSFFLHECELLHGWLLQKQKMLSVLGPVSYDLTLLEHQKQQVDLLLEELGGQRTLIDKLHEESEQVLKRTKESERQSLLGKLQAVDELWADLGNQLENRRRQIENAGFASQVFTESCQTLNEWLDEMKRVYENFVHGDSASSAQNQLQELDRIEAEISGKAYLIKNTENAAATLCEVLNNEVISSEINSKLDAAKRQYADLQKRGESLRSGLERNVKQGQEFELAFEELSKWLRLMDDRVRPDVKISALLDVVSHQLEAFDDVRSEVARREYDVHALLKQGRELGSRLPAATATRLDAMQAQWTGLDRQLSDRHKQLSNGVDLAKRYKVSVDVLEPWLAKAEHIAAEFKPPKFKQEELDDQVREVQDLRTDISGHSGDLDAVQQHGSSLLTACEADLEGVRDAVDTLQTRWDTINEKTMVRARSLEDIAHRLGDYEEAMATLQGALAHAEEKLVQAEDSQLDQKSMDRVMALKDDVDSMKRQMDLVEDLGHGLLADGQALDGDVSHIEEALLASRTRYHSLDNSIADTMEFLEKATAAVGRFVDELKQTEQCVNELEDELDNMGPQGKDLETLTDQLVQMDQFVGSIDDTAKEVHDVEEALEDLVENSYVSNPEPWREQIDGMKDQLANLALRANNRETELKLASEKMEEFHNTLNSVMQSLSTGEDGEHLPISADANGTQQLHQQFFRKLDGVLAALNSTADKLANCEPISALPGKLQKQMEDNNKLITDLAKRSQAYESAKRAAGELAKIAGRTPDDGEAVDAIQDKLANLDDMWDTILKETERRGRSLEDTYKISVKFWKELADVQALIKEFEAVLQGQEPPAVEVNTIRKQQDALQELKEEFNQTTQPDYEQCVSTGQELMVKCGEPDKPEVKKNMEDLDHAWGNITQLFMQRDTDLVEAMEKSMTFHGLLQSLLVFLEEAEDQLAGMGSIGADIEAVKRQMEQLKAFRAHMEPHTVEVESLIAQADELIMKTSEEQALVVQGPVEEIRERWDSLNDQVNERKKELEEALVHLGQFRHALDELVAWIVEKEQGLDEYTIPSGDPKIIELELAKHKVLLNDLIANERTLDILNEAGSQIIEESEGGEDAASTSALLDDMNLKWQQLLQKADIKQTFLEEHLKEAESFQDEIQDLLNWLADKDQHLIASRPVGGLPQTAKDQLANFMELYNDLEANKAVVEQILRRGAEYLTMAPDANSVSLDHNLKTLKHRWEAAQTKANDRKIKLEIAVRDAVEFYESLQGFTLWLTNAEKGLSAAKPPSRVLDVIVQQIEEHKTFQEDLSQHLPLQGALDKKGTTLKYFSQKQDVVQIKNLLASVQQRWDKLVSASADRQRALNTAYTEGREFSKHHAEMLEWIDAAEQQLDGVTGVPNDPEKIRAQLAKHKEFVKAMASKQAALSGITKMGRILKESAAKGEQTAIQNMLVELQKRWKTLGSKSAERQRKLEEALLFSGQLKDALTSMLDWLTKLEPLLAESLKVHGDLDTVKALDEQFKAVENDLSSRAPNIASVKKAAKELLAGTPEPDAVMARQLEELEGKWDTVRQLAGKRRERLNDAMRCAVEFHQVLYSLIEWLGATEMKIRVFRALPDDVKEVQMAIFEIHEQQSEMQARQVNYDTAMELGAEIQAQPHPDAAATVRHWLKVLGTRWQELELLMKQREQRLKEHMTTLEKSAEELEQLLVWFFSAEANLVASHSEILPEELDSVKRLIQEHQEFETELYAKQATVERQTQGKLMVEKEEPNGGRRGARRKEKAVMGNNAARDLFTRNRNVLQLAAERRERLAEQLAHVLELEKLQNFQFDDWRRRFVRFMNVKKLRVMDFFRRLDRDADGKLTRDEFIDCILKSNFQTTPLEMEIVADIFDQNKDGFVDYPEFVHALKPDWRSTQNLTDADKIEDEVTFQVQNCTCKHHYKVQHVGEGRYIFGESQKLRLVRILRSTVMVRVGGGWVALDEFLVKNDPCRAKGRTNIELREQFILPEGASQSMTPFKAKSHSLATTPLSQPTMGPITKIREKSVHGAPWRQENGKARRGSLETSSEPSGARHTRLVGGGMGHSHTDSHLTVSNGRKGPSQPSSRSVSQRNSRAHSPERPSHSASSHNTNSNHSRSSSVSNVSNPGLAPPSTASKIPSRPTSDAGGKTQHKLNGHPRKR